ncbi:MAG: hypothetical protein P1P63_08445 [Treponemataceae bacterium]
MIYTTNEVATKTKTKPEAVRYFARKNNLAKIKIKNSAVFIFDKKDFDRYVFFIGQKKEKKNEQQLVFDFYEKQSPQLQKKNGTKKELEKALHKRMQELLKRAGDAGMRRIFLAVMLEVTDAELESILAAEPMQPIGEDDRIDDRIYWVGKING